MTKVTIQLGNPNPKPEFGFGKVARLYLRNGFKPIPVEGKRPSVRKAIGYKGTVTTEKVLEWIVTHPDSAIGLRAEGFITVDVDHHDEKFGADQLLTLEKRWGPLPPTVSSTSRGKDSPSRQYFFRVPEDVRLQSDPMDDIEIVYKFNRFAVVAPSIHPITGEVYVWYGPDGEPMTRIPTLEDFHTLPPLWFESLQQDSSFVEHDGVFEGDLKTWQEWLGEEEPFWESRNLKYSIEASAHIGHHELMRYLLRIHHQRKSGEASYAPVFRALIDQFKKTTHNPEWAKELDDLVRWVVGANWNSNMTKEK